MTVEWERRQGVGLRLILIRHGEPEESAKGRCCGKLDVGLSQLGRQQMVRVSRELGEAMVDAVYTSPRRRARESAEALSRECVVDERLSEIDFGELEGLAYEDAAAQYPDLYEQWMSAPTEVTFPGGESFSAMKARVFDAVASIRRERVDESIVIVSHGGVNRIILADALGVDASNIFHMDQSYACINIIDELGEYSVVRLMNGRC